MFYIHKNQSIDLQFKSTEWFLSELNIFLEWAKVPGFTLCINSSSLNDVFVIKIILFGQDLIFEESQNTPKGSSPSFASNIKWI